MIKEKKGTTSWHKMNLWKWWIGITNDSLHGALRI
jgi:hypothetical protein